MSKGNIMKFQSGEPKISGLYLTRSLGFYGENFFNVWDGVWYATAFDPVLAKLQYERKRESNVQNVEWILVERFDQ